MIIHIEVGPIECIPAKVGSGLPGICTTLCQVSERTPCKHFPANCGHQLSRKKRRTGFLFFVLLGLGLACGGCASREPQEPLDPFSISLSRYICSGKGYEISATEKGMEDHCLHRLKGATIRLQNAEGKVVEAISDPEGRYTLPAVAVAGRQGDLLSFSAPGYLGFSIAGIGAKKFKLMTSPGEHLIIAVLPPASCPVPKGTPTQ